MKTSNDGNSLRIGKAPFVVDGMVFTNQ
jgi:hypothetical protein